MSLYTGIGIIAGMGIVIAPQGFRNYFKRKNTLRKLESSIELTVEDLEEATKNVDTIPYAAVTGQVFPVDKENTLYTLSGIPAVILMHEAQQRPGRFKKVDSEGLKYIPFTLSNTISGSGPSSLSSFDGKYLLVEDVSSGIFQNLLTPSEKTPIAQTASPGIPTGWFSSFLRAFRNEEKKEVSEKFLSVGSVITVIGQVTKLSDNTNGFRLSKPSGDSNSNLYILTSGNIADVKKNLESDMTRFAIQGVGGLICVLACVLWYRRKCKEPYSFGEFWSKLSYPEKLSAPYCALCFSRLRTYAVLPCKHVCLCHQCFLVAPEHCPLCEAPVHGKTKAYSWW